MTTKEIIGEAYKELQEIVQRYAQKDLPVLLTGETGSGKELFMELYKNSSNRTGEKMTVNCAAFSDELLRSEVFGHEQGAFTGADKMRKGKIEVCDAGILALDEIGDASPQFQATILRVCEGNTYFPVGSDKEKKTNALIIAATNSPEKMRQDLKERFHILPIPPLQRNDIPALATYFLKGHLKEEYISELQAHAYRGNVRELKRMCERLKEEKEVQIFNKKPKTQTIEESWTFDYRRYVREKETWSRYIAPIIDKYGKENGFDWRKYEYQSWDGDSLNWILYRDENLNPTAPMGNDLKGVFSIISSLGMYEIIKFLKKEIGEAVDFPSIDIAIKDEPHPPVNKKEAIKEFKKFLSVFFSTSTLPCLLAYIYLRAERPPTVLPLLAPPNLTPLLDLPWDEAKEEFLWQYHQYNRSKHKNTSALKKATGKTKKSIDQLLRRKELARVSSK